VIKPTVDVRGTPDGPTAFPGASARLLGDPTSAGSPPRPCGPVPRHILAEALKVTPRAVTGLVDALVAQRLVTREAHPTDRRATLVALTPRGETLVAQLKSNDKKLARALFASVPYGEFESFAQDLAGVIDRPRAHLAATGRPS
jgi:MarR family